ncbi:DUF317 domain-containing protein [Streptomyces sp. YIM 98790]|uniref:DUF317 domain-containing protein n=1 Tax=Streptomyces sp. YIM 98790 TaxID=2689077 RepID=UPI0014088252|nr:DUF317 domain-containing protein [Streptomyces sp. YIM 98790]
MGPEMFHSQAAGAFDFIPHATTPGYLAGAGDPRYVTEALRAAGWSAHQAPGVPHVLMASPTWATRLLLEPDPQHIPSSSWWRLQHGDDTTGWSASFGGHTPVEILGAVTDALLLPAPDPQPDAGRAVWQVLEGNGWAVGIRDGDRWATSPDHLAHLAHRSLGEEGDHFYWMAEVCQGRADGPTVWRAHFNGSMPVHLIGAFADAFSSAEPLYRPQYGTPVYSHQVTQVPAALTGETLAARYEQRLSDARAQARAARRAARRAPTTPETAAPAIRPASPRRRR